MSSSTDSERSLGRAITVQRAAMGMSRRDLAEAAGVSYPYLAAIEKGDRQPSSRILQSIASALHLTVKELWLMADEVSTSGSTLEIMRTTNRRPGYDMPVAMSMPDQTGLEDILSAEVSVLRQRVERLELTVRDLRYELSRLLDER